MNNIEELEKGVAHLCDKLDRELYLKTIGVPTSKLIFTQPFLMEYRIQQKMKLPIPKAKDMVCVVKENTNYVIVGGNCTAYSLIKRGFKRIKVRVFDHDKALKSWVGRRFYNGKQIRINFNQIKILKNLYDYHENNRKLLWFALALGLYQLRERKFENWHYEGCVININKNNFLIPEHYITHENRQDDEPLLLVKMQENTFYVIDGIERLNKYKQTNKTKIEAWIFTIYNQPNIEAWLKEIPYKFNTVWNRIP